MKILLMNGHGGNPYDSGAVGNGYKEAELTRELADLIEKKLKKYATVVRYPKDRNAYADVQNGTFANYVSGGIKNINYAFEIHFNAYKKDEIKDGIMKGTECYVTSSETGITVEQAIMKNLSKFFPLRDNDNIFDGVKRTNFAVIQTCKNYGVSGALLETCFIDDADDIAKYKSNKDAIAQAIVDGIATGFGLKATSTSKPSTNNKPSTSKPSTTKKTNDQIADEVIAGKWGTGTARKNALEKAGYDYNTIQAIVNKKLGATTTTSKKTVSQLADEVIAGKWGTGNTRKEKLEAAGYNYDAVQTEVNKKLGISTSTKKTVTTKVVNDVINGKYGNGTARKTALEKAGYDYDEVQAAVNKALS